MEHFLHKWIVLVLLCLLFLETDALNCYMCPRKGGQSLDDANLECLALGWELSCTLEQDRCYSTTFESSNEVEKGCTQSQSCLGTTSCCQGDFCNADPQNSLTGYGKQCNDLSDCIQGADVMRCDRLSDTDFRKVCLCTETSYNRGATCQRKSYPDESCTASFQCLDVNSTCVNQMCVCDHGMYSNSTRCEMQKSLGEPCQFSKECGGSNTACNGMQCSCEFGFEVVNGTDSCSGTQGLGRPNSTMATVTAIMGLFIFLVVYV